MKTISLLSLTTILALNFKFSTAQIQGHYCEKHDGISLTYLKLNHNGSFILETYFKTDLGTSRSGRIVDMGQYTLRHDTILFTVKEIIDSEDTIMIHENKNYIGYYNSGHKVYLKRGLIPFQLKKCSAKGIKRLRRKISSLSE